VSVIVVVPPILREHAAGAAEVRLDEPAPTVAAVLAALFVRHPALRDRVVGESGQLRPHVNVFVDSENIRFADGLQTAVADGAEVTILPAVSGG
jgi:molybdopterin converting factor small subunit